VKKPKIGARANQWDSSPAHVLRRDVQGLKHLTDPNRRHVILVVERILKDMLSDRDDMVRQVVIRSLGITYAGTIQAQQKALASSPGTPEADRAWSLCLKLQDQLTKRMRELGLKAVKDRGPKGKGPSGVFSPPRQRAPSELAAMEVPSHADDSDDSAP
jgi:hypothetical protein